MEHEHFMDVVSHGQSNPIQASDKAKIITEKFKNLRRKLRAWQAQISSLNNLISNVKLIMSFLELVEEYKDLSLMEWNFKEILKDKLQTLLHQQKIYWQHRGTIKGVKFGDESTKFFHVNATIKHRKNFIRTFEYANGNPQSNHHIKESILWEA